MWSSQDTMHTLLHNLLLDLVSAFFSDFISWHCALLALLWPHFLTVPCIPQHRLLQGLCTCCSSPWNFLPAVIYIAQFLSLKFWVKCYILKGPFFIPNPFALYNLPYFFLKTLSWYRNCMYQFLLVYYFCCFFLPMFIGIVFLLYCLCILNTYKGPWTHSRH